LFDEIVETNKCGEIIIESIVHDIRCISVHPQESYLAIAGTKGYFCLWNYNTKESLSINYEYKLSATEITSEPSVMEWTPDGKYLIVAYKGGTIRYLEMVEFENHNMKISLRDAHQAGKISESSN
jgi:WD40 repeat protein